MILAAFVQFAVCFLILLWLLKKKTGEPFAKKTVVKFLLFGALAVVLSFAVSFVLSIEQDTFFGMNPLLSGFLTALITAALFEELAKYLLFRLAVRKNGEVQCWLDGILAAVIVAIGFTLLEDLTYLFSGGSLLRALLPGHLLFQAIMGYYYGKARVTKQVKYDVLSIAVPMLVHTLFDMFIIGLMSIVGDKDVLAGMSAEQLGALPYANYLVPLVICTVVTLAATLVALILAGRKISLWSKNGEKQELLHQADA